MEKVRVLYLDKIGVAYIMGMIENEHELILEISKVIE